MKEEINTKEEIKKYIYDNYIKDLLIEEGKEKKVSKKKLNALEIPIPVKKFILYIIKSSNIKISDDIITKKDRSPRVKDNNYGEIKENNLQSIDEPVMSYIEYSLGNEKVFEDYQKLDEFLQNTFIPECVSEKQIKNAKGEIEIIQSVGLYNIVALELSEAEFDHVMEYLESKKIQVRGTDFTVAGEFENYSYINTYKEKALPLSVPSNVTIAKIAKYKEQEANIKRFRKVLDQIKSNIPLSIVDIEEFMRLENIFRKQLNEECFQKLIEILEEIIKEQVNYNQDVERIKNLKEAVEKINEKEKKEQLKVNEKGIQALIKLIDKVIIKLVEKMIIRLQLNKKYKDKLIGIQMKFVEINAPNFDEKKLQKLEEKNKKLKEEILNENLRLVPFSAYKYAISTGIDIHELESYGYEGLIKAFEKFNVNYGYAFSTFAINYIKGYILKGIPEILTNGSRNFYYDYIAAKKAVEETQGISLSEDPTLIEDVIYLLVTTKKIPNKKEAKENARAIINLLVRGNMELNLEEPEEFEESGFAEDPDNIDEEVEKRLLHEDMEKVLSTLTEREAEILKHRFGYYAEADSVTEISRIFKISESRIRQIEAKALRLLRHPSRCGRLKKYLK